MKKWLIFFLLFCNIAFAATNSGIDTTKPVANSALVSSEIRNNFVAAKAELEAHGYYLINEGTSLQNLCTTIGSSNLATIIVSGAYTLTATTTITSNITLEFTNAGKITLGAYNLTINGTIVAPSRQIFNQNSTGTVTFGSSSVKEVNPEWFGAIADGSTNNYQAVQNALNSMVAGQILKFGTGDYVDSTASQAWRILTDGITVEGERGTNILVNGAQSGFVIGNNDTTDGMVYGTNTTIVTNGAFTSDATGWTAVDSTLASIAGGQAGNCLEITRTAGTTQTAKQNLTTVAGKSYIVAVWVKDTAGKDFQIGIYDNDTTEIKTITGTTNVQYFEEYFFEFKAASTTTTIRLVRDSGVAGTMLFDTVRTFSMVSDVTIRGFNFKNTSAQTGQYGIWATYANNLLIENVSGGDISAIVAIGNDGTDECSNVTVNNVFSTGDTNHSSFYKVGLYRVAGANINNLHLTHKGGAVQFVAHDSYGIHISNINTQQIKGFEFTRVGGCTLNGLM